jgi:hypothetical protein
LQALAAQKRTAFVAAAEAESLTTAEYLEEAGVRDEYHGEMIDFKVFVKTGDEKYAGTDANVHMQMFGEKGESERFMLAESAGHRDKFERSRTDIFHIKVGGAHQSSWFARLPACCCCCCCCCCCYAIGLLYRWPCSVFFFSSFSCTFLLLLPPPCCVCCRFCGTLRATCSNTATGQPEPNSVIKLAPWGGSLILAVRCFTVQHCTNNWFGFFSLHLNLNPHFIS